MRLHERWQRVRNTIEKPFGMHAVFFIGTLGSFHAVPRIKCGIGIVRVSCLGSKYMRMATDELLVKGAAHIVDIEPAVVRLNL